MTIPRRGVAPAESLASFCIALKSDQGNNHSETWAHESQPRYGPRSLSQCLTSQGLACVMDWGCCEEEINGCLSTGRTEGFPPRGCAALCGSCWVQGSWPRSRCSPHLLNSLLSPSAAPLPAPLPIPALLCDYRNALKCCPP